MAGVRPSRRGRVRALLTNEVSTGVDSGDDTDWPTGIYNPALPDSSFDVPDITYGTPAEGTDPTAIRTDATLPGPPIVILTLTNKSGGSVAAGDVVVVDTANDTAFTTTTTGQAEVSVGIAQATIANNASGAVLVSGYAALVSVPSSMTRGRYLETHTVAKQATGSATRRAGSFGQFLISGTTPTAWLWGQTDQTASGGGSTITTKDEGSTLSSTVTTLDFVGAGVTASGAGATTTVTIPGGSGALTLISTTTLGSAAATIDVSGISGSYKDLVVVLRLRGTDSGAGLGVLLRVGNSTVDTGANYGYWQVFEGFANGNNNGTGGTSGQIGSMPNSGATAAYFGHQRLEIMNYADTSKTKGWVGQSITQDGSGMLLCTFGGHWRNTSQAIDIVRVLPTAGNFDTGSSMTVYGRG